MKTRYWPAQQASKLAASESDKESWKLIDVHLFGKASMYMFSGYCPRYLYEIYLRQITKNICILI